MSAVLAALSFTTIVGRCSIWMSRYLQLTLYSYDDHNILSSCCVNMNHNGEEFMRIDIYNTWIFHDWPMHMAPPHVTLCCRISTHLRTFYVTLFNRLTLQEWFQHGFSHNAFNANMISLLMESGCFFFRLKNRLRYGIVLPDLRKFIRELRPCSRKSSMVWCLWAVWADLGTGLAHGCGPIPHEGEEAK